MGSQRVRHDWATSLSRLRLTLQINCQVLYYTTDLMFFSSFKYFHSDPHAFKSHPHYPSQSLVQQSPNTLPSSLHLLWPSTPQPTTLVTELSVIILLKPFSDMLLASKQPISPLCHSAPSTTLTDFYNHISYLLFLHNLHNCFLNWRKSSSPLRLGADCGSDHELLIAKFRLKLKKAWDWSNS